MSDTCPNCGALVRQHDTWYTQFACRTVYRNHYQPRRIEAATIPTEACDLIRSLREERDRLRSERDRLDELQATFQVGIGLARLKLQKDQPQEALAALDRACAESDKYRIYSRNNEHRSEA